MGSAKISRRSLPADVSSSFASGEETSCDDDDSSCESELLHYEQEERKQQDIDASEHEDREDGCNGGMQVWEVDVGETYNKLMEEVEDTFERGSSGRRARSHQADCVTRLVLQVRIDQKRSKGRPVNYLIQHATGTGKSLTISSLCLALLRLPDQDSPSSSNVGWLMSTTSLTSSCHYTFVIILTDRLQLDRQLGDTIEFFLERNGHALIRCRTTGELAEAINQPSGGRPTAILSTIQKFAGLARTRSREGAVEEDILNVLVKRHRVAIIADEAHRSHGQRTSLAMHELLGGRRSQSPSINYFGFSATPSRTALKLFGRRRAGGGSGGGLEYAPAHCYSMQDAIADGHVLNPLANYTCVRISSAVQDKERKEREGTKSGRAEEGASPKLLISAKSEYILKNFLASRQEVARDKESGKKEEQIQRRAEESISKKEDVKEEEEERSFKPRAMVVCKSRADVVAFTLRMREICHKMSKPLTTSQDIEIVSPTCSGYDDLTVYGAFSGEVMTKVRLQAAGTKRKSDGEGGEAVSEAVLNRGEASLDDADILVVSGA
eukprot:768255-Hanusia_phi.AAC.3